MATLVINTANVAAVLVGTEWFQTQPGTVGMEFAEYETGPERRWARGFHLIFTIQGGPHNGERLAVPLDNVTAIRMTTS